MFKLVRFYGTLPPRCPILAGITYVHEKGLVHSPHYAAGILLAPSTCP
jgi:hypothetical protein